MRNRARLLQDLAPADEHREIWNAPDEVARGQPRVSLGVHFQHESAAREAARRLLHLRGDLPARPAPRRPKIDQDRHLARLQQIVEGLFIDLERLAERR